MGADLKINVSADVQQAIGAIKALGSELNKSNTAVNQADIEFAKLTNTLTASGAGASRYGIGIKQVTASTNELQRDVAAFGGGVKNTNAAALAFAASIKKIASEAQAANPRLVNLQRNVAAFGGGVKSFNPAVAEVTLGLKAASESAQKFNFSNVTNGVSSAYGVVRKLAQILPGIGIAGLFGLAFEGIGSIVSGVGKLSDEAQAAADNTSELVKKLKDLSLVSNEAAAGESGNIAKVRDLAKAVTDTNLSYDERKRALAELKEINKSYFGDLTLETSTYGKLTGLVNDYAKALVNQAITKRFTEEIADTAKSIADADDNTTKAKNNLNRALADQARAEELLIKAQSKKGPTADDKKNFGKFAGVDNSSGVNLDVVNSLTRRDIAIKKVKESEKILADAQTVFTKLTEQRAEGENRLNAALREGLKLKDLTSEKDKKPKSEESLLNKQISDITKEISALETLQKQGVATRDDLQKLFSLKIEKIELELPKSGLTAGQAGRLITQLQNSAEESLKSKPIAIRIPTLELITGSKDPFEKLFDTSKALKGRELTPIVKINPQLILTKKQLHTKQLEEQFAGMADSLASSIKVTFEEAFAQVGETIASVFTGGDLQSALKGFASILGEGLIQIGKIVIGYAISIKAIKTAINKILAVPGGPVIAIGLGIAAIALGSALKKSVDKSGARFAEGGLVTGPTNALIGEKGPEVVFPLSKLNSFLRNVGGGNQFEFEPVRTFISSEGIYQSYQAYSKKRGRI